MPSLNCEKRKVYSAFGFLLESEISVPGLKPVVCDSEPDVRVVFGKVKAEPESPYEKTFTHSFSPREAILRFDSDLMFYIGNGKTIIIEASDSVPEDKITAILLDFPFAVLLIQRGFFVLHGATVIVDGRVVTFLGRSGEGKSALAHGLWRKGQTLIGDDLCAVKITDNGPAIFPGIYRLSVWRDTIEASGGLDERYRHNRADINKFFVDFSDSASTEPVSAEIVYFISEGNGERFTIEDIKGYNKLKHMMSSFLHHEITEKTLGKREMFRMCAQFMGSVTSASICKNSDLLTVSDFTDAVIAELEQ
jgi:hypothetical protein